ncbi:MAG TPA: CDP-glycerol glycerophosphotransferase family protein [Nocardioidaceae bacterium]|nr:CDP-glycerol glycerophosphotransferase family protein [Nocardioidaceae bacterium]
MASTSDRVRDGFHRLVARSAVPRARLAGLRGSNPRSSEADEPLLSVVVPVYQVEDYLAECLDSLLGQTYHRLEIVLVDDGSTDLSSEIARGYAERDTRIVLVHQENAGLGSARNTGLARSSGALVTFADSDDTVPPNAYRRMVSTLQRSGSDFVVGALVRQEGGVERMRSWAKQAHARRRIAVTIDDVPAMLTNVMACTKVFRREFLDSIRLRFPEGTRYEDQVPITRAYLEARSFDVLPDVVYRWRKRDDKSSLSQRKTEMQDLVDRLAAHREIAEFLHECASPAVLHTWYVKTFRQDFFGYLRVAADADDGYWEHLQESIVSIAQQAPSDLDDQVELRARLAVWLGRHGHRDALRDLVRDEGFRGSNFPVTSEDGQLYARVPSLKPHRLPVPENLVRIRTVDLRLHARLESLDWSQDGVLSLRCLAALSYVDPSRHDVTTAVTLVGPSGTAYPTVPTRVVADPVANAVVGRAYEDHSRSSVVAEVDLEALVGAGAEGPVCRWQVGVTTAALAMRADANVEERAEHGSAIVARSAIASKALVSAKWSERRGLVLEVRREYAAVTSVTVDEDAFVLELHAPGLSAISQIHVGPHPVSAAIVPGPGAGCWTIRLLEHDLSGAPLSGRVRVAAQTPDRQTVTVVGDLEPGAVCVGEVCLTISSDGLLTAAPDQPCLLVDDVAVRDESLVVSGRAHRVLGARLQLKGPRARTEWCDVEVADGCFAVEVPLRHTPWGETNELPANGYAMVAEAAGGRVRVLAGGLFREPWPRPAEQGWSVEVGADRRLVLRRTRLVDRALGSRFGQTLVRSSVYAEARNWPSRNLVLFECFSGTGTGDGPRAVCDQLLRRGTDLDLVWSVDDRAVAPVAGTRAVLRGTPEWYEAVGSARLLVNNDVFPEYFRKGPHQLYVQTWHGTPLKRIGTDIPHQRVSAEHYLRRLAREASSWDLLLSSSPYSTAVFRKALGYHGRILEIGRPSNDVLAGEDASITRAAVRARLGIPATQTVLLYAPTWRDNALRGGTWEKVLHLDSSAVTAARPDLTVLVRGHPKTASRSAITGVDRVIDVTSYPDIAPLYLAADVLVTDYSAAMFDFALTDKPMIFLVPDLEAYRDRIRGLYLDLEAMAPGPLVRSTEEVLRVLGDDSWSVARKQISTGYAPYDDGGVTDRLLSAVGERLMEKW